MKRKLISYDVFERIEKDSLSNAETELYEAKGYLAEAVGCDCLELKNYGLEDVTFETCDGTYVHANYRIKEGVVEFSNIEELVIDEQSEKEASKQVLHRMIDSILDEEDETAVQHFEQYLGLPSTKRVFSEAKERRAVPKYETKDGKRKRVGTRTARWEGDNFKKDEPSGTTIRRKKAQTIKSKKTSKAQKDKNRKENLRFNPNKGKRKGMVHEWRVLAENVMDYVDYNTNAPVLSRSQMRFDEKGNVTNIAIPSKECRHKNKMEKFKWDVLSADNIVHRMGASKLSEDMNFAKSVAELKRHNNLSDNDTLEETIENIVSRWPDVLYLTQTELADVIGEALEMVGATNFDDEMCDFMAEGILRVAHNAYVNTVGKIQRWAGVNPQSIQESEDSDSYLTFKSIVDQFYPVVEENMVRETQVYVDLYESLRQAREVALDDGNRQLQAMTESYLDQLLPIVRGEGKLDLELAEEVASFLYDLVETNLGSSDWSPSNSTHTTVSGDHPAMAQKAKHGYTPASDFSGDWGDVAPVSDGKNYKGGLADQMRNSAWGNLGGDGTYPSLQNPYVPKPFGSYEIKGEKTIDADSGLLGHTGGNDTWPSLQNPYVPQSVTPQTYKMNHGKEADLVVDK